jgi:hypothetical protein
MPTMSTIPRRGTVIVAFEKTVSFQGSDGKEIQSVELCDQIACAVSSKKHVLAFHHIRKTASIITVGDSVIRELRFGWRPFSARMAEEGDLVLVGADSGSSSPSLHAPHPLLGHIILLSITKGGWDVHSSWRGHSTHVTALEFCSGDIAASGCYDGGDIKLWNIKKGLMMERLHSLMRQRS